MDNNMSYTPEIKKGLINLLMFSLYSEERTIYREYVQNALDAINKAVEIGVLNATKDGWVKIDIDKYNNVISIKDNGCGIKYSDAARILLDISASEKNGINQAGQFGIGRLVGGGYCHKLTFRTSFKGENKCTKIIFDVDKIWDMVKNDPTDYLATTVIEKCTNIIYDVESESEHYFEVILEDIKSESAPALLNIEGVIDYLNVVAPVEYKVQFETLMNSSCTEEPEFADLHNSVEKVQLFVNSKRIQKQYGLTVNGTKDNIERLEYFKLEDSRFGVLGWGWFALTKYSIQIPSEDNLACIRLRKHNIQIGGNNLLSGRDYWREERSNSYFYGEFFVTHANIMPNAARDGLAPTPETNALIAKLQEYFTFLKNLYTKANEAKKSIDKIKEGLERMKKFGINDYNAKDLIDNKGIAKYVKLVKNASFAPIIRMLELYKPAFTEAVEAVESYKKEVIETSYTATTTPSTPQTPQNQVPSVIINTEVVATQEAKTDNTSTIVDTTVSTGIDNPPIPFVPISTTVNEPNDSDVTPLSEPSTNIDTIISPTPTYQPNVVTRSADIIKPLERVLDPSEIWIIRRVFNVLNTYCPKNEHDLKLIASLEELIVKEFENN